MGRHDIARWGRESPFSPTTVLQWDEARRDPRHAMHQAAHNQTLPGLDAINTTRRTLLLPAGLLQPAATYVFAFTAYVVRCRPGLPLTLILTLALTLALALALTPTPTLTLTLTATCVVVYTEPVCT